MAYISDAYSPAGTLTWPAAVASAASLMVLPITQFICGYLLTSLILG
jgi:hypothetical protein